MDKEDILKKKIDIKLEVEISNILEEDSKYFKLSVGEIFNTLFRYYANKDLDKKKYKNENLEDVYFVLDDYNSSICDKIILSQGIDDEKEYIKILLYDYISKSRYLRERIIFEKYINKIMGAISKGKKIILNYNNKSKIVNPYFIKYADMENVNYLFCYCEYNKSFEVYKISEIKDILELKDNLEVIDEKYIRKIYKSFDPYLSYGHKIKVKLTEKGEKLLGLVTNNKPKYIKKYGDIYLFECSSKLAEIYFSQFLDEVEILEPLSTRKRFKEIYEKLVNKYNNDK